MKEGLDFLIYYPKCMLFLVLTVGVITVNAVLTAAPVVIIGNSFHSPILAAFIGLLVFLFGLPLASLAVIKLEDWLL